MISMRILHLASFSGNYKDIVNHNGFYNNLARLCDSKLQIDQEEIRDYYTIRKNKSFDSSFVEYVNKYDLLVIGGGNFFLRLSKNLQLNNN